MEVGVYEQGSPVYEWRRRALKLGACIASLATLTSCAVVNKNASPTPTVTVTKNIGTSPAVFELPSIQPVIVTMPGELPEDIDKREREATINIKKGLAMVAETLNLSEESRTAGVVLEPVRFRLTEYPINSESGKECITEEQYKKIDATVNAKVTDIILPPGICEGLGYAAKTTRSKDIITLAGYAVGSDTDRSWPVFAHELGHVLGLGHNGALIHSSGWTPTIDDGSTDFGTLITRGKYRFAIEVDDAGKATGEIDQYAGTSSVMGNVYDGVSFCMKEMECQIYNTYELNKLRPDIYRVADVPRGTINAEFTLSTQPNASRGIRISLPGNHPLRSIPGGDNLTSIVIGMSHIAPGGLAEAEILATDDSGIQTYQIRTISFIPELDKELGRVTLYTDEATGFRVEAETINSDSMKLYVSAIGNK